MKSVKSHIMIPPPQIIENGLLKDEVKTYLDSGLFDVSWYIPKTSSIDVTELLEILSKTTEIYSYFRCLESLNLLPKLTQI